MNETNMHRLRDYAEAHDLRVRTRFDGHRFWVELMSDGKLALDRASRNSYEDAAFYLVNTLGRLGCEVSAVPA